MRRRLLPSSHLREELAAQEEVERGAARRLLETVQVVGAQIPDGVEAR